MISFVEKGLASLSLLLKQALPSYCDLETSHGDAFVTKTGHYVTWLRVDGMQRMAERKNFAEITEAMRLEISGALETRGHAIVGYYISDPDAALVEIENASMGSCRVVAEAAGLDLGDIFAERAKLWPRLMRW
jgi:intracellular multiplication protein IcmB